MKQSRVRLDPLPPGSFGLRAYDEPVDADASLDSMRQLYALVGVVTIFGKEAIVTQTKGKISQQALTDFDTELRTRGIELVHWCRHRKDGTLKSVTRRLI